MLDLLETIDLSSLKCIIFDEANIFFLDDRIFLEIIKSYKIDNKYKLYYF